MNQDNKDFRTQYILHPGDMIQTGKTTYTITDGFTAYGGSAVVYSARCSEDQIDYVIKEVFPNKEGLFQREKGIVCATDPNDERSRYMLENYRSKLVQEQALGSRCFNNTILAVPVRKIIHPDAVTIDGSRFTDVSYSPFAVLDSVRKKSMSFSKVLEEIRKEESEDHPLRTGDCPALHTTACLMEQVLLTLQTIHRQNVLFGDLHLDNVLFSECRLEEKRVGVACFLDFGCARELIDGEKTAVIEDKDVLSTKGYIPPEILHRNDGTLQLTRAADIFSVGCLLLRCLVPEDEWDYLGVSPDTDSIAILPSDADRLRIDEKLRRDVNRILKKALNPNPGDRPSVDEMLEDIQKLITDTAPPTYLLPKAPCSSESFVEGSRKSEINDTLQKLMVNTPTFLWGCGGIGKSEIAIQVAKEFEKRSPKGSYFIHYTVPANENQEAMEVTVLRMPFEGYKYEPERSGMSLEEQRKADYRKRFSILQKQYAGALLVIDNFDWLGKTLDDLKGEKSYLELESIGLNLLFTTRNEVPGTPEVKELSREDLLKLMRRWVTDPRITDQQLYDLIEAVDGHTLTVDIMAKTLSEEGGRISPEMMLEAFQNSKLADEDYPEVTHRSLVKGQNPDGIGHRDPKTAQIYEHLKALFDLSGMSQEARKVLSCATLLPDSGMDALLFSGCLETPERKRFWKLIKQGWLRNSDDNVLSIHPIVRAVCRGELKPATATCHAFLSQVWKTYNTSCFQGNDPRSLQIWGMFIEADYCNISYPRTWEQTIANEVFHSMQNEISELFQKLDYLQALID